MNVSVLGAGGFVGGHLVRRLVEDGHGVTAVDIAPLEQWWQPWPEAENLQLDLRDPESADIAVSAVDWVFDLAEDMGGVGWLENNRVDGLVSFRILLNVAEACAKREVERLWFSSSACAYNTDLQSDPRSRPLCEDDAFPARPERGYGEAKWMGERLCEYMQEEGRLETRVGRYHAIYGPYGTWTGGREKSPLALARKIAAAKLTGHHNIDIWGDGTQERSYCFISDCIDGTMRLMESDCSTPLNIGSSRMVTINDLVTMLEEIAGIKVKRWYQPDAPLGVRSRCSDNQLIRKTLDWEPSVRLEDGLAETYAWVEAQVCKELSFS